MVSVLYVDDEPRLLELAQIFLERSGEFSVGTTTSAREALVLLKTRSFDAIISDYQMPEMDGIAFLKQVRSEYSDLPFILFTGKGREEIVIQALNEGADFYLQKGGEPKSQFAELAHKIRQAVSKRETAQALRQSKQHYRSLIKNANEAIFVVQDQRLLMANPKLEEMTGYTEEELMAVPMTTYIHPDDRDMIIDNHLKRLRGEAVPPRYPFRLTRKDQTICWAELSGVVISWDGHPAVMVFLNDITKRRQAEEALRGSEEQFRNLLATMPEIVLLHKDGIIVYVNQMAIDKTGYSRDELVGSPLARFIVPGDRKRALGHMTRRIGGEGVEDYELNVVDKSGGVHHVIVRSSPVLFNQVPSFIVILDDITERERSTEALHASEKRFRELADMLPQLVYETDVKGNLTYSNRVGLEMTGYTHEDLRRGLNVVQAIAPEDRERATQDLRRRFERMSPEVTSVDYIALKKDGTRFPVTIFVSPILEGDRITGIRGIIVDRTERHRAEVALRESEEKYRLVVEHSHDAIYIHAGNRILFANRMAVEVTGYTADELLQIDLWDLVHPDDRERLKAASVKRFSGENVPSSFTARIVTKTGTAKEGDFFVDQVIFHGHPAILGLFRDITEQRRTEISLRESEEKFRSYVENANEILYSLTIDGIFSYVSPQWTEQLGHETSEVIGNTFAAFVHPDDLSRCQAFVRQILVTGKKMSGVECRVHHKNGSWQRHISTGSPIRDDKGNIVAFLGTCHDVTEQKRTEDALHMANRQLNLLTGITRHDIRNQILALKGYLELSKQTLGDSTKISEYIAKKERATDAIERQIAFTKEYQDLGTVGPKWIVLDEVIHRLPVPKRITLGTELPGISIFSDPMLEKVFSNLLDNSIRHGGHVTAITVSSYRSDGDMVIVWQDNGVGIPADEKERIFERGFGKNTGFGMFLVREILSLTGISIRETGEPGAGARFEIVVSEGAFRCEGR
jgi:PAS domain S-box-containing protein